MSRYLIKIEDPDLDEKTNERGNIFPDNCSVDFWGMFFISFEGFEEDGRVYLEIYDPELEIISRDGKSRIFSKFVARVNSLSKDYFFGVDTEWYPAPKESRRKAANATIYPGGRFTIDLITQCKVDEKDYKLPGKITIIHIPPPTWSKIRLVMIARDDENCVDTFGKLPREIVNSIVCMLCPKQHIGCRIANSLQQHITDVDLIRSFSIY